MLLLFRNYTLAPAFRLKPSVIPVATRHFLSTSSNNQSPPLAQGTGKKPKAAEKPKTAEKPKHCKSIKNVISKN
jgi:hypothetical protein